MTTLTLDRDAVYEFVKNEMARVKIPTTITRDEVDFIADAILEEMKRQYLMGTGQASY